MATPELIVDPDAVIRAGRAGIEHAHPVRAAADGIRLGVTGVESAAARARLVDRTRRVAARLEHNGRSLLRLGAEFRDLDGAVSLSFLLLVETGWR